MHWDLVRVNKVRRIVRAMNMKTVGKPDASRIKSYVPRKYLEVRINLLVVTGLCEISGAKPCETRVMICTQRYAVPPKNSPSVCDWCAG